MKTLRHFHPSDLWSGCSRRQMMFGSRGGYTVDNSDYVNGNYQLHQLSIFTRPFSGKRRFVACRSCEFKMKFSSVTVARDFIDQYQAGPLAKGMQAWLAPKMASNQIIKMASNQTIRVEPESESEPEVAPVLDTSMAWMEIPNRDIYSRKVNVGTRSYTRSFAKFTKLAEEGELFQYGQNPTDLCTESEAHLVSSQLIDPEGILTDLHMPAIDIDHPVQIRESSPGKFHLYIDVPMSSEKYFTLLRAMAEAGIVELGYADSSKKRGRSYLRLPDIPKRGNMTRAVEDRSFNSKARIAETMKSLSNVEKELD